MVRRIALEEAFSAPSTRPYLEITLKVVEGREKKEEFTLLLENSNLRIQAMNEAGIDIFVLSQTSPGVQAEKNAAEAVRRAREANDYLQKEILLQPTRYRGFAHLPMQDVDAAADELERCVKTFGFLGALINGNTDGFYLDHERYLPFWERVARLNVPVYIHPADPHKQPYVMEGYPVMQGAVWGWSVDNSSHFLRLLFSGLFDRFPTLQIILGHMGETLPYFVWRIDSRYAVTDLPDMYHLKKKPSEYFRSNLIITTAGLCQNSAFECALKVMGDDRVLFSVDYPYEDAKHAVSWVEHLVLTDAQRDNLLFKNAERVLKMN
jgi:2,3-dihydroxybenzoate decarboxylase